MSATLVGNKRRWIAAAAGALVVMLAMLSLLRVPTEPVPPFVSLSVSVPNTGRMAIQLTNAGGADQRLTDEASMHDQIPLFLPTSRNVALKPPPRPEAGRVLLEQEVSRNSFGSGELRLNLPAPEVVAERPVEVMLAGAPAVPLYGFGRSKVTPEAPPPHGAFVEVFSVATNRRVLGPEALGVDAKPPTERIWRPLEFLARVNATGLAGPLTLTVRSDVEEVDKFFRNYLGETFRIGDRLPPGSYRITVGP